VFNLPISRLRHAMFAVMASQVRLEGSNPGIPDERDPHHLRSNGRHRGYRRSDTRHRLIQVAQRRRNAGRIKAAKKIEKRLASLKARELNTWRNW
jgi:hypothetical protein